MKDNLRCWEFYECNKKECPAYESTEPRCWLVSGTHCHNEVQEQFLEKIELCLGCKFFKANRDVDSIEPTLKEVDRQLKNYRQMVEEYKRELESNSLELTVGLSEAFEGLKHLCAGNPEIEISETSELELVRKLKAMVNLTAKNVGETVNLSHEFAIGLAEHFDTLTRVSKGDFSARVSGASQEELLQSLATVTNYMIESVSREIAQREAAEDATRVAHAELKQIFETSVDGMRVVDKEFNVLRVNKAFATLSGKTETEAVGEKCYEGFPSKVCHTSQCSLARILSGEEFLEYEVERDRSDGTKISCILSATPFCGADGTPIGVVENFRDVTELKHAEILQRNMEAQLRQAYKMEAIGTLAGGIAHDFNNVLGIIIGNLELAADDVPTENPAHLSLDEARKASMRARDMVKQILAFSRFEEKELKPININPLVKESMKMLRGSIPTTIDIHQDIKTKNALILGDPTQIHQVLINLCTNAAQAMEEMGGVLQVRLATADMDKEFVKELPELTAGRYIRLTVSDTGHGIPPDMIGKVFDPYFTTKEVGKGTGMGLATVHGIVTDHGGTVRVYSEVGKGTTFHVFIPELQQEYEGQEMTEESLPGGNERILLVDDEVSLANVGKKMLESLGHTVETRTSSIEALECFKANPDQFDLVISDVTMPNLTGEVLAKELIQIRSDIPVVLCTGFSDKIDEEKANSMGIKAFVMKPLDRGNLANTVRQVLDNK